MIGGRTVRGVRRGREGWQALLSGFGGSGLSAEAYCRREGISSASFYRWRSKLSDGGEQGRAIVTRRAAPAFVDLGALRSSRALDADSRLTQVSRRLDLRLDLGDGLVLHLVRG
jgi:putative transposase